MQPTLFTQFSNCAIKNANLICLCDENTNLTYQQTLFLVLNLALDLQEAGVNPSDVVALYSEKNIESVIYFLALSYLGATVLTLDMSFPVKVIDFILKDASAKFFIYQKPLDLISSIQNIRLKSLKDLNTTNNLNSLRKPAQDKLSIAWIVYSSGTTGNPKGIAIQNYAIINSIFSRYEFSNYTSNDKVLCSIYFFWEVFRPLFKGASIYLINDNHLLDITKYLDFIATNKITETLWTPSFAQMILLCLTPENKKKLHSLKRVWLNGEVVLNKLKDNLVNTFKFIEFFNLYSISETFDVAAKKLSIDEINDPNFASIGLSLLGVDTFILDGNQNLCKPNQPGELYVASKHLALAYLNQPELTSESFVKLNNILPNEILFKTKDTAYKNDNDEIIIMGRNDHIVKLRGYNVSVLAIEDVIKKTLPIDECIVVLSGDDQITQSLTAHILPKNIESFIKEYNLCTKNNTSKILHDKLAEYLAFYAIPTKFFIMHNVTLNEYSAKLDRKNIIQQDPPKDNNASQQHLPIQQTKDQLQLQLQKIWQDIFEFNFTESHNYNLLTLGANSLQIMQYVQQINKIFALNINIENVYTSPDFHTHLQWINGAKITTNHLYQQILDDSHINITQNATNPITFNLQKTNNILITGVSGFLGVHWLSHLLKTTNCTYYCLVRSNATQDGFARLQQQFEYYHLDTKLLSKRVKIVTGSLDKPFLDLNKEQWEELTRKIEIILHAGALVNLLKPYDLLKDSIVTGTKTLLQLATTHTLKPFILISSDAVLSNKEHYYAHDKFVGQDALKNLTSGYAQAKWAQERLLQDVHQQCKLPYIIFRFGNLGACLNTAIANPNDTNHLLLQFMAYHRIIPDNLRIEFTPIDKVINFITTCALKNFNNQIYTITDLNVLNREDITQLLPKLGLKIVPQTLWQDLLKELNPMLHALYNIDDLYLEKPQHKNPDILLKTTTLNTMSLAKEELIIAIKALFGLSNQQEYII